MILCSEEKRRELSHLFSQAYIVNCLDCKKEECVTFRKENNLPLDHVWCPNIELNGEPSEAIKRYKKLLAEWQQEEALLAKAAQEEFAKLTTQEKIERVFEMYSPKIVTVDEDGYLRVEQHNNKNKSEKETNT